MPNPVRRFGRHPWLGKVTVGPVGVGADVHVPNGFDWRILEARKRTVLAGLGLGPGYGWPEDWTLNPAEVNASKVLDLHVRYRPLPNPYRLDAFAGPAPSDHELVVGMGRDGWVRWNMDEDPHFRLGGATGKGKGVALMGYISQAVQAGWLVIILDGQGSPEHDVWEQLPNVWRIRPSWSNHEDAMLSLEAWLAQLVFVREINAWRYALCVKHKVSKWSDLPLEVRLRQPRVLFVVDEASLVLARAMGVLDKDVREEESLRAELGAEMNRGFRGWRKYGVNILFADQMTYAGSHLGDGALAQASAYVFLGSASSFYQLMIGGRSKWPKVANRKGHGVAGRREEDPQEIRIPRFTPDMCEAVVAAELRRRSAQPDPQPTERAAA